MIAKKNSRFDLEQKRTVLFQIGLMAAGSFMLAAFTYKSDIVRERENAASNFSPIEWVSDPIIKKEEPKEVVVQQTTQSNDQNNQNSSNATTSFSENSNQVGNTNDIPTPGLGLPDVGPVDDGIISIDPGTIDEFPDEPAEYIGGYPAMQGFIGDELQYPQIDIEMGKQGKVFLVFIIETDGSVSNVGIERGVSETIDREAKRIVRSFPKWKPAENAYGKVRTRMRLPINFVLAD